MIRPVFKNVCVIKIGVFMSVMFWAAGEEVPQSGLGKLVLRACVGRQFGQFVRSLQTTFRVL